MQYNHMDNNALAIVNALQFLSIIIVCIMFSLTDCIFVDMQMADWITFLKPILSDSNYARLNIVSNRTACMLKKLFAHQHTKS